MTSVEAAPQHWLLFPVETASRELDFRVVLAALLADPTRRILVGHPELLRRLFPLLGGGLYVGKNLVVPREPNNTWRLDRLHECGLRLLYLDEEGAVYPGDETSWRKELRDRIDPNILDPGDRLCAWGTWQAAVHREDAPHLAGRIDAPGHPRFDLCKPQWRDYYRERVELLRQRYGRFVLVNTNLARVNHAEGITRTFSARSGYRPELPQERLAFVEMWRAWVETHCALVELVHILSVQRPDLSYIVRPHPSENADFYRAAFSGVSNVHVVRDESVVPWLAACHAMIHDGCTTAIEGSLAGARVINYKAVDSAIGERVLPNLFGRRAATPDEVLAQLDAPPLSPDEYHPTARAMLANLDGDSFAAFTTVVERHLTELPATSRDLPRRVLQLAARAWDLEQVARAASRVASPVRRASAAHVRSKFDRVDDADLDRRFAAANRVLGRHVRWHRIGRSLFEVSAG